MLVLGFLVVFLQFAVLATSQQNSSSCTLDNIAIHSTGDVKPDANSVTMTRFATNIFTYELLPNATTSNATLPLCVRASFEINVDRKRCSGILHIEPGDAYYQFFELNLTHPVHNVTIVAEQLGNCLVVSNITGEDADGHVETITERDFIVHVIREQRALDQLFQLLMMTLIIFGNIAMGIKTDLKVVVDSLKKPVGPAIALSIQFILQPLIAWALIAIFGIYPEIVAFGFFIVGTSPSGTASNFHTYLLGGDVSLAVTVTLTSTLLSLGAYPLWIYTLGTFLMSTSPASPTIPFEDIVLTLAEVVVPVLIGLVFKYFKPGWALFLLKYVVQPYLALVILYMLTAGIYTNLYLFEIVSWYVLLAGCLLPWIGFGLGYIFATIFKESKDRRIAIMIEAGLQNVYIPVFMLRQTFSQPDSDLASVGPLGSLLLGPIPLYATELFLALRGAYQRSEKFRKIVNAFCCCCCPSRWRDFICPYHPEDLAEEDFEEAKERLKLEASLHRSLHGTDPQFHVSFRANHPLRSGGISVHDRSRLVEHEAIGRKNSINNQPDKQPLITESYGAIDD